MIQLPLRASAALALSAPLALSQAVLPFPLVSGPDAQRLTVEPAALEAMANLEAVALDLVLPNGAPLVLELERSPSTASGMLHVDGVPAGPLASLLPASSGAWRGKVAGFPESAVQLALSPLGCRGSLALGDETWHLMAEPGPSGGWEDARSVWRSGTELARAGLRQGFTCEAVVPEDWRPSTTPPPPGSQSASTSDGFDTIYNARLALETDYAFFQKFGSVIAAADYAVLLTDTVSAVYLDQRSARPAQRLDLLERSERSLRHDQPQRPAG
jgi:hypothetical protein